ncbi:unnamed protein product, partial [Rotaria magnacalcarata]
LPSDHFSFFNETNKLAKRTNGVNGNKGIGMKYAY